MPPLPNAITLTSPATPHEGDRLTFHWTTGAPDPTNWIGVYDGDRPPGTGASLVWAYTPGESGDTTLDTSGLTGGPYTAYLLAKDAYGILARTEPFTFTPRPVIPRPHAAVDALTTAPQDAGAHFTVRLAGLWIRPEGNPAGQAAFRRLAGDSWLLVSGEGTVSGTAPATARHPGQIVVGVQDSALGSGTVTVQVPVRKAKERLQVKVATVNLWDAGSHVEDALEKQLRVVLTQNLDVVALQETGGAAADALAGALGWHVHQTAAGLGLVSRHPLSHLVQPTAALPAAAATVHLPGGRTLRVWTAHLDEADYGPYAVRSGRTAAQVEAAERQTARYRQVEALLAAMRGDLAGRDTPVVLAASLASPSHLDWTARTSGAHGGAGRLRWPVTEALEQAGLTDAFRAHRPNPAKDPGITWSPVRPATGEDAEPQDRIDQIHYAGRLDVLEAHALFTGWPRPVPDTAANGWPSDHAAAVATFTLPATRR